MRGLILFLFAGGLGLFLALWTWTRPGDPALFPAGPDQAAVTVHILNNGFHTDLAVPRQALEAEGGPLAEASRSLGQGDWILIGWGERHLLRRPDPDGDPDPGRAASLLLAGQCLCGHAGSRDG